MSQELENIPLFMTRPPEVVDAESAPALAALQDIKYNEETPYGVCVCVCACVRGAWCVRVCVHPCVYVSV